jgi:hypothetical protein
VGRNAREFTASAQILRQKTGRFLQEPDVSAAAVVNAVLPKYRIAINPVPKAREVPTRYALSFSEAQANCQATIFNKNFSHHNHAKTSCKILCARSRSAAQATRMAHEKRSGRQNYRRQNDWKVVEAKTTGRAMKRAT